MNGHPVCKLADLHARQCPLRTDKSANPYQRLFIAREGEKSGSELLLLDSPYVAKDTPWPSTNRKLQKVIKQEKMRNKKQEVSYVVPMPIFVLSLLVLPFLLTFFRVLGCSIL